MAEVTPLLKFPYPSKLEDPWFSRFEGGLLSVDVSGYAAREDRNLVLMGGGVVTWDSGPGLLSWAAPLEVYSPIQGFLVTIPAGSVNLSEGQVFYINLTRAPVSAVTVPALKSNQVPSTDVALLIGVRRGSRVYFRNGAVINNGDSYDIFQTPAAITLSGAVPIPVNGPTGSAGVSSSAARGDHTHRLEVPVQDGGVPLTLRSSINFIGATVADDPGNDRTNITVGGAGGGATGLFDCPALVAVRDFVYISGADAVDRTDATSIATAPALGIVISKPTGITAIVQFGDGEITGFVGLTTGARYYLATSLGAMTDVPPAGSGNILQRVGRARNTTTLVLQIDEDFGVL